MMLNIEEKIETKQLVTSVLKTCCCKISLSSNQAVGIKNQTTQCFETYIEHQFLLKKLKPLKATDKQNKILIKQIKCSPFSIVKFSDFPFLNRKYVYYFRNPFGSQSVPDFMIILNDSKPIQIEYKSSKNKKAVWNCSLPSSNIIYLFYSPKFSRPFIFFGFHLIPENERTILLKIHSQQKKLSEELSKKYPNMSFSYYARPMFNQQNNFEESNICQWESEVFQILPTLFC